MWVTFPPVKIFCRPAAEGDATWYTRTGNIRGSGDHMPFVRNILARVTGRGWRYGGMALLIVVAVLAGYAAGSSASNAAALAADEASSAKDDAVAAQQEAEQKLAQVQKDLEETQSAAKDDHEKMQARIDTWQSKYKRAADEARKNLEDELAKRTAELDARAEKLDEREAAITQAEEIAKKSEFGTGTFEAGVDIVPGKYRAPGGPDCYWEKLNIDTRDILDNNLGGGQQIVPIQKGILFASQDCGTWTRAN